ncbi:MAG: CinA family protein [Acholeplasmataceae bacterium]
MKSQSVLEKLKRQNLKIAFAESMTGGSVVSRLIKHGGASEVCELGLVTYSNEMKHEYLDITPDDIKQYGVVSKMISMMMAENVCIKAYSNIGVGVTGNAGPTKSPNSDVGEVWVSIYILGEMHSYHFKYASLQREEIINKTTDAIYSLLDKLLG